jgi:DNA-binding NarL/FixJ family response regulator
VRRPELSGLLEPRASRAVQVAAGHGEPNVRTGKRQQNPGGPTRREVEVFRLAARGLTDRLTISSETADHRIQHICGKIGVSTRAAATLCDATHLDRRRAARGRKGRSS